MSYCGKIKCVGCGKTGEEVSRYSKDSLCPKCTRELKLGRCTEVESKIEYTYVRQHLNACRTTEVSVALHNFLESIHNPYVLKTKGSESIVRQFGDNCRSYNVDSRVVVPLQNMMAIIKQFEDNYLEEISNIPRVARQMVNAERNKIFNEGVEYGRKLLQQLNFGEVTLSDFEKDVTKY